MTARKFLNITDRQLREWQELLTVRWDRIDMPRARHLLKEHEQSLRMLEEDGGDLAQARERWEAAKSRAANVQGQLTAKRELLGATRSDLKRAQTNQEQAKSNSVAGMTDEVRSRLTGRIGSPDDGLLDQLDNLESDQQRHESRLCQVTWEEIDERLARRAALRPEAAAALAGVDLKVVSS
jgi:uncharacterized protein YPO0396